MADKQWYAEGKEIVKGVVTPQRKGRYGTGFGSEWSVNLRGAQLCARYQLQQVLYMANGINAVDH